MVVEAAAEEGWKKGCEPLKQNSEESEMKREGVVKRVLVGIQKMQPIAIWQLSKLKQFQISYEKQ